MRPDTLKRIEEAQDGDSDTPVSNVPAVLTNAHKDPAAWLGFPPMLPIELALREASPREICESYGIDRDEFAKLCALPAFQKAFDQAQADLAKDGMGFRVKARIQAEALLETSWALIHSPATPSHVKASLITQTWKVAGLEPKPDGTLPQHPLQINIQLNN